MDTDDEFMSDGASSQNVYDEDDEDQMYDDDTQDSDAPVEGMS